MTGTTARGLGLLVGLPIASALAAAPAPAAREDARDGAIGVAPFASFDARADDGALPDVGDLLAVALERRTPTRVVAPGRMELGADTGPATATSAARDVRRWADLNRVDSVVVGRAERVRNGALNVDVELRSGHSGAAAAEYRLEPASAPELPAAVDALATLILADLDAEQEPAAAAPKVEAAPELAADVKDGRKNGATDDTGGRTLSLMPGAKNDDPISINSEELEVVPLDGGRRLVFSRNVVVVQGDIQLTADRLEAVYPEGATRPERLLAEGRVAVAQGERRASCEQATYERRLQTIVCRGRAEVVQGCDRVRGEEIEFDLEKERVRVSGAASVLIRPDDAEGGCARAEAPGAPPAADGPGDPGTAASDLPTGVAGEPRGLLN